MRVIKYSTRLNADREIGLVKESSFNAECDRSMNDPEKIWRFCTDVLQMDTLPEEYVYMICKDNKGRLIGFFEVSHGTINASACDPRSIYQKALLCNAASIVVVHNHPSGDSTPSQDDVNAYERIKEAGKILGIRCAH